jgi:hypothetical protein
MTPIAVVLLILLIIAGILALASLFDQPYASRTLPLAVVLLAIVAIVKDVT